MRDIRIHKIGPVDPVCAVKGHAPLWKDSEMCERCYATIEPQMSTAELNAQLLGFLSEELKEKDEQSRESS